MPVTRSNPSQTSYLRKLLAYSHTHAQDLLYKSYGIERFQVLTLITSEERITTMIGAYRNQVPRQLRRPNQFLFVEQAAVKLTADIFRLPWFNANGMPATLALP